MCLGSECLIITTGMVEEGEDCIVLIVMVEKSGDYYFDWGPGEAERSRGYALEVCVLS